MSMASVSTNNSQYGDPRSFAPDYSESAKNVLAIKDNERQPCFQDKVIDPEYMASCKNFKIMIKNKKLYDAGQPLEDGLKQETFEADYEKALFNFKYNSKKVHYLPKHCVQTEQSMKYN